MMDVACFNNLPPLRFFPNAVKREHDEERAVYILFNRRKDVFPAGIIRVFALRTLTSKDVELSAGGRSHRMDRAGGVDQKRTGFIFLVLSQTGLKCPANGTI